MAAVQPPGHPTVRPRGVRSAVFRVFRLLAIVYIVWCVALLLMQDGMIFPREAANTRMTANLPPRAEQLWMETDAGRVEAWFVPGAGRNAEKPGPIVMCFHGNADVIDQWMGIADSWNQRGFSVLLPEYRGYGRSAGAPSQKAIVADMAAWHKAMLARPECDGRIVLHGRSLGGGVAAAVADRVNGSSPVSAVVLDTTFTSIRSYAHGYGAPGFLVRHPFATDEVLPRLGCPVFIAHGRDDDVTPISHARTLAGLAKKPTLVEMSGGHLDFPSEPALYTTELNAFLVRAGLLMKP